MPDYPVPIPVHYQYAQGLWYGGLCTGEDTHGPWSALGETATPPSPKIEFMQDEPYLHAIGKLTWLANGTRSDIAYAAGVLVCFNNWARKAQWTAVKHLLHYIKGTLNYKLHYGPCPHPLGRIKLLVILLLFESLSL